jgi:hypothetical protein
MIVDPLASPAVAGFSVSKIRGQGPSYVGQPAQPIEAIDMTQAAPVTVHRPVLNGLLDLRPGPDVYSVPHREK